MKPFRNNALANKYTKKSKKIEKHVIKKSSIKNTKLFKNCSKRTVHMYLFSNPNAKNDGPSSKSSNFVLKGRLVYKISKFS